MKSTISNMSAEPLRPPGGVILTLPKAGLHLHLEGSNDPVTLLELRRHHGKSGTLAHLTGTAVRQDYAVIVVRN